MGVRVGDVRERLWRLRERFGGEAVVVPSSSVDTKKGVFPVHLNDNCSEAELRTLLMKPRGINSTFLIRLTTALSNENLQYSPHRCLIDECDLKAKQLMQVQRPRTWMIHCAKSVQSP